MITWEKGCLRKFTHRKLLTFVVWTINSVIDKKDDYARDASIEFSYAGLIYPVALSEALAKTKDWKFPFLKSKIILAFPRQLNARIIKTHFLCS